MQEGLVLFCGSANLPELTYGETTYLTRALIAPADTFLSETHAPEIFSRGNQWFVRNNYEHKKLVVAEVNDLERGVLGLIIRIPPGSSQRLPSAESYIYLGSSYRVFAEVKRREAVNDVNEDLGSTTTNTLSGMARDADTRIRELLAEEPWRTATFVRFQEFMDPLRVRPEPLAARRVLECAPHLELTQVNNTQRKLKDITGLDASVELGDWMTHRGILLGSHYSEVPHSRGCAHWSN